MEDSKGIASQNDSPMEGIIIATLNHTSGPTLFMGCENPRILKLPPSAHLDTLNRTKGELQSNLKCVGGPQIPRDYLQNSESVQVLEVEPQQLMSTHLLFYTGRAILDTI